MLEQQTPQSNRQVNFVVGENVLIQSIIKSHAHISAVVLEVNETTAIAVENCYHGMPDQNDHSFEIDIATLSTKIKSPFTLHVFQNENQLKIHTGEMHLHNHLDLSVGQSVTIDPIGIITTPLKATITESNDKVVKAVKTKYLGTERQEEETFIIDRELQMTKVHGSSWRQVFQSEEARSDFYKRNTEARHSRLNLESINWDNVDLDRINQIMNILTK